MSGTARPDLGTGPVACGCEEAGGSMGGFGLEAYLKVSWVVRSGVTSRVTMVMSYNLVQGTYDPTYN